jgi:hypothetical protein
MIGQVWYNPDNLKNYKIYSDITFGLVAIALTYKNKQKTNKIIIITLKTLKIKKVSLKKKFK